MARSFDLQKSVARPSKEDLVSLLGPLVVSAWVSAPHPALRGPSTGGRCCSAGSRGVASTAPLADCSQLSQQGALRSP